MTIPETPLEEIVPFAKKFEKKMLSSSIDDSSSVNPNELLVRDFCLAKGGHSPITKVLIANNGMAAVKAIRSIRKWSYETFGTERAVSFTAMATPEDLKMNAEYIRMADNFIEIPGGSSHNNYSNVDLIVDVAERTQSHAVYVGWGFASENPVLADRLAQLDPKVVFIGPPPTAMRSLGDKIASTIVAQSANVPCVDWSGKGLVFNSLTSETATVPHEIYEQAMVDSAESGLAHAERIGFPVMIKASEGGGGKGIRLVYSSNEFKSAFIQVQREVVGSPIFVMQVVQNARHLEVQVLADQYGNAIALFGRDCSVQRRHQKIIEEAPVTIAPPEILRSMEQSAVNLAKMVGYTSAGTVEYLYEPSNQKYYFLELNPRLQVEHPTTEMVSGVNLPAAQLQIAMGIPLSNIIDIRILYGLTPNGTSPIDFEFKDPSSFQIQRRPAARGHVIATRITAENPDAGFKPNSGKFLELNFKSNSNVWGYFSVNSAGGVHEYADSQFGHLFGYGESREEARKSIVMALKEISIRGDFRTTVEYLVKLLENPDFASNNFSTSWLDGIIKKNSEESLTGTEDDLIPAICGAVSKTFFQFRRANESFLNAIQKGKVPMDEVLKTQYAEDFILNYVQYQFQVYITGPESFSVGLKDRRIDLNVKILADDGLLLVFGRKSHIVYLKEESGSTSLMVDGCTFVLEKYHDPSLLRSPSPGKLVRYLVKDGDHLFSGDAYAEIEVMKIYMPLITKESGIFTGTKLVSSVLAKGDVIGHLQLDDPSAVKRAISFSGSLPLLSTNLEDEKPHHLLKRLSSLADNIMLGYEPSLNVADLSDEFIIALHNEELPVYEFAEALGSISSRIPQHLCEYLYTTVSYSRKKCMPLNFVAIEAEINSAIKSLPLDDQDNTFLVMAPLFDIMKRYSDGVAFRAREVLLGFLENYIILEQLYEGSTAARVILGLRETYKNNLEYVRDIARSASKPQSRSDFILFLLDFFSKEQHLDSQSRITDVLASLAHLTNSCASKVSFRAREILIGLQTPSITQRRDAILTIFDKVVKKSADGSQFFFDFSQLSRTISSRYSLLDILPDLFFHPEIHTRAIALYTYIMRTNQAYTVTSFEHHFLDRSVVLSWDFEHQEQSLFKPYRDADPLIQPANLSFAIRKGIIFTCETLDNLVEQVRAVRPMLDLPKEGVDPNSDFAFFATVVLKCVDNLATDELAAKTLNKYMEEHRDFLKKYMIRRTTFMILVPNAHSRYFTFKSSKGHAEDATIRHIEPFMAHRLEMDRLSNFDIKPCFVGNRGVRLYHAVGKSNTTDVRFFVRGIIYPTNVATPHDFFIAEGNRITSGMLDTLELLTVSHPNTDCNHILLHFIPVFNLTADQVQFYLDQLLRRHRSRLSKLRVTEVEICFIGYHPETRDIVPFRFIASIQSQYVIDIDWYYQKKTDGGADILISSLIPPGPLHGQPVYRLHDPKQSIHPKRYRAHLLGTAYVYDFPALFQEALKQAWSKTKEIPAPGMIMDCKEMVLNSNMELQESVRPSGSNHCGMIVFKMKLWTPEYPQGRILIVIANDITYHMGSFGPIEDLVFLKASQLARRMGVPRIYISANSGARIGLADEVLSRFKIAWHFDDDPLKGFEYLYLDELDYNILNADSSKPSVDATKIIVDGKVRYKLAAIIGHEHGLGVENLHGSGEIAGETSKAYKEIFTITLVTCRSVGIGAYLVRLGQRVIQVEYAPIILTGASALNKVLGSQVYTSNLQLGGTRIMFHNGVSHLTVQNDFEGIAKILQWLSYVPAKKDDLLPIIKPKDSIDRHINIAIPKGAYDPRILLKGVEISGEFRKGFFDFDSVQETLAGWAQGVVVGRARLGGIPVGFISVETRATEAVIYADPAVDTSQEEVIKEAGQVWYPNSAFKTAQAIRDFNYGEQLPLIIFANWRGFSGGQSDMSKEILKFGAQIVDALREYNQPIFIYIIGELRGGAWVVVDPSINPEMMEMYCYENARGGILEPQGIVEIKYRTPKIIAAMERLDSRYLKLKESLLYPSTSEEKLKISAAMKELENNLIPIYEQAAAELADLHDRPERMLAKKVVQGVIPWESSRSFFYWRILRKLKQLEYVRILQKEVQHTFVDASALVNTWFLEQYPQGSDEDFVRWCNQSHSSIVARVNHLKHITIRDQITTLAHQSPSAFMEALASAIRNFSPSERQHFLDRMI